MCVCVCVCVSVARCCLKVGMGDKTGFTLDVTECEKMICTHESNFRKINSHVINCYNINSKVSVFGSIVIMALQSGPCQVATYVR